VIAEILPAESDKAHLPDRLGVIVAEWQSESHDWCKIARLLFLCDASLFIVGARQMNKRALIQKIAARLTRELEVYFRAAQNSRAEATHEQSKAESKYDTRGLEASYLARGQSKQAAELEAAIAEYQKLDARRFSVGEPIDIGAVVELEIGGEKTFYFLGPRAGGTEVEHDKKEILVITPQSPLGAQLMEKKQGDRPQIELAGRKQPAWIVSVL